MSKLSDWIEAHRNNPDDELAVRNYVLNTEYYEREYANAVLSGQTFDCHVCGYPHTLGQHAQDKAMQDNKVCFSCWYWLHYLGLKNGPTSRSIIVNGTHYVDGGNRPKEKSSFLGFGGSKWAYRKIDEADYVETNNMWHQGKIPKRFNIPDTHEFKPHEYKEVKNGRKDSPFES